MKKVINYALIVVTMLSTACQSNGQQAKAKKLAKQIQETMNANKPGMIATSANGYYMKAVINGKPWEASHIYATDKPNGAASIVGERGTYLEKGSVTIGIHVNPIRRWLEVGKKFPFGEGRAVDFVIDEDTNGGYTGELVVTKMDDRWVEGSFYFTATNTRSGKKYTVTNGSFRVEITKED